MKHSAIPPTLVEIKGMPTNIDAERFILGSILLDESKFDQVISRIGVDDFALEKHRRIFTRMGDLRARNERIDRLTLANELLRFNELEMVDGLTYIVSLDDGLPLISSLDSYARIVRDKSALRRLAVLSQHTMNRAILAEDSAELILSDTQREMTDLALTTMDDARALNLRGVLDRTQGGINAFLKSQANAFRMASGYPALDDLIYGFQPKKTYIIAGDSSHGKTSLALNIVQRLAIDGYPGLYFTVEMGRDEMLQRMVCGEAKVSLWKLAKGYCDQQERSALSAATAALADLPLYLDDTANLTITDLVIQARRAKQKWNIKWIVVDYIQILDYTANSAKGGRPLSEYEGLTAISRAFKMLSKTLDVSIIVLSQFSKNNERTSGKVRRPIVSDLHGSGALGKDADVVMFVWRPWLHTRRDEIKHHAELIVAKHRGGPLGFVNLAFSGDYTRFFQSEDQLQKQIA